VDKIPTFHGKVFHSSFKIISHLNAVLFIGDFLRLAFLLLLLPGRFGVFQLDKISDFPLKFQPIFPFQATKYLIFAFNLLTDILGAVAVTQTGLLRFLEHFGRLLLVRFFFNIVDFPKSLEKTKVVSL
jgi:hypothetical protein